MRDPKIFAIVSFAAIAIAIPPIPRPVSRLDKGRLKISATEIITKIRIKILRALPKRGARRSSNLDVVF